MPELPEVETVRRGLLALLPLPLQLQRVEARRADLRWPLPDFSPLSGARLEGIERHGKYLLWNFPAHALINHLGMSGSWRQLLPAESPGPHDHVLLHFDQGLRLCLRDPRRFGMCDLHPHRAGEPHPRLARLGPDPIAGSWPAAALIAACHRRRGPIKQLLLNQQVVAGIGNIYACEALFQAGIHPLRPAGRIAAARLRVLHAAILDTLQQAIAAGGSTIRDFRQAGGSSGYFQHAFQVYDRAGQPCRHCSRTIRQVPLSGRSTWYCPRCQR